MHKLINQKGVLHILPLLVIIAAIGIISFLLITSTAPFTGGLFQALNPKQSSHAATSGCGLTNPAFCETFDEGPSAVRTRSGDLDPTKWSASRMAGSDYPINVNPVAQGPIPPCRSTFTATSVFPPDDTLICDPSVGKSAQLMTATTIQYYGSNSYMIRQPFDFAGRTGKIDFDVDAHSDPLNGFIEVVITDSPVPATTYREFQNNEPGPTPLNGLVLKFVNGCASAGAVPYNTMVYTNAVGTIINPTFTVYGSLACSTTQQDMLNHMEIQLSQNHIEVYGSDFSTDNGQTFPNFHRLYGADINLPFTRGYVHFDARNHATTKYAHVPNVIYHWDNIGFDGPVIPADRAYEIPDNTHSTTINSQPYHNLGWTLLDGSPATGKPAGMYDPVNPVNSLSFQNVNVTGATSARLALNTSFSPNTTFSTSEGIKYLLNGGANGAVWHTRNLTDAEVAALNITGSQGVIAWTIDVNKNELVNGTNTIQFLPVNATMDFPPVIANIDLLVSTGTSSSSTPVGTATPTPSPSSGLPNNTYTTNFPLTESPISEGGIWLNGKTNGLDWQDTKTTTGKAFGTQTGSSASVYDDTISVLKGTFGANQEAFGTVFNNRAAGDWNSEVELHLRSAISAHSATGYEFEYSTRSDSTYCDIVRWDGGIGKFTPLIHVSSGCMVKTGDIIHATAIGNVLTAYINGVQVMQTTDSTFPTGNPGVGFYLHNFSQVGNPNDYGLTHFSADTISSGTPTPTPTATPNPSSPPTPVVTVPSCINPGYTGSGVTISWASVSPVVSVVDLGYDSNFNTAFNKYTTNGATSVTGPAGFSNGTATPSLNPNTTYYTRSYNGIRSQVVSFTIPACSSTTPTPTPACLKGSLGDTDCNGTIDIFDYNTVVSNFGKSLTGVVNGDFDNNGTINIFDYNILVTNFGK